MTTRRNFLKNTSLCALGGLFATKAAAMQAASCNTPAPMRTTAAKNIGLQIYSLGGELFANVPVGLKKLKDMGYATIELAGYSPGKVGNVDMMEFKKMADDAGLVILSSHVNPPVHQYTKENKGQIMEFWKQTADDHAKMGVTYLVQPGQPSTRSLEETQYVCEVFNDAGKVVKEAGLPFGYHNHDFEFAKVVPGGTEAKFNRHGKGDAVYDVFLRETDPSLVFFEMDVFWTVMGQNDPVRYLKQHPDRIKLLHIKDSSVLGQSGMMNFETIFNQFYANGNKDYFVELEGMSNGTQFEGVKGCADYLLKSKFVK